MRSGWRARSTWRPGPHSTTPCTVLSLDGVGDVALDLEAVTFADSSAVAWLLTADRRIRTSGGRLTIVACSVAVRELLRLTGIEGRIIVLDRGSMP